MTLHSTENLMSEHKLMLRAIYVLKAMADRIEEKKEVRPEDVEKLLDFLKKFGDEHHQCKEESILFPALRKVRSGTIDPALHQLMFEHEQERSLVEGLQDALRTKKGSDFVLFANQLAEILDDHIYREDHVLFNLVDRVINPEEDLRLEFEMTEFDNGVRPQVQRELIHSLNQLEQKYLGKAA